MWAIYFSNVDLINETPPLEKQRICMNQLGENKIWYFNRTVSCLSEGKKKVWNKNILQVPNLVAYIKYQKGCKIMNIGSKTRMTKSSWYWIIGFYMKIAIQASKIIWVWGSPRHQQGEPSLLSTLKLKTLPKQCLLALHSTDEREGEGQFSEGKFVVLRIKNFDNFSKLPLMGFVFKKVVFKLSFWLQTPFSMVFNLGKKSIDNLQFSHLHFHYVAQAQGKADCEEPAQILIWYHPATATPKTACRS